MAGIDQGVLVEICPSSYLRWPRGSGGTLYGSGDRFRMSKHDAENFVARGRASTVAVLRIIEEEEA